ncbi:hypothetical protein LR48_Vigan1086s001500 [Vigna angularis]|uniref:DUF4378 domain-containing protein n=2 Tax=Phaseolus angularis TaxID=3914 RepID=A0A0L9TI93_PHAAN|nr:uncharacterized protein LOC108323355 [Vigna angularis]KAG2402719.1 uncharacterized protein HKW66_Vig0239160 [Vigna angularis]KOM30280.1 hypothetical protein LR48_Vigan1086s001500 [Vigna angularis]BAT95491.1 hypothetical protein VIGAN_08223100 [Vigna angularis var. angularis]
MQMLIDKEMSKQKDSKHYLPNVVAKLMGLETLPSGEPNLSMGRSYRSAYPQQMHSPVGFPFRHWQQEDRFMEREILHEVHPSTEQVAYKEMYEIWQQSQRARHASGKVPDRGRWSEDVDGKRMALIRQKFIEAKHLSTDERMRQSKQFKDALEVLSSNSDLLMRLLDSQNVYEFYSSRRTDTKRITLIKPSKMDDNDKPARKEKRNNRLIKKSPNVDQAAGWENKNSGNSPDSQKVDESPVRTTRIVLLKPSPGRTPEQKDAISPTTTSPPNLRSGNCHQGPEYDDAIESIRVAKEITQQMHKDLWSYQKDKTPHYSSVISNGYSDDESSFNKSYHEYASANFSDLEAMSMSSLPRLSWDYNYINGCSSPYSTMSLGRVPCSPESSVCREAKKRLSERWTMMTSDNKGPQEQTTVRRNSTLGEMLSLTHTKKSATSVVESIQEDQEPGKSVSCSHSFNAEISNQGSPKNLPRSNSVSASSTVNGTDLTVQVAAPKTGKSQASRAQTKSKRRSTFKEKVASLLFSKSKKSTKEKPSSPQSKDASQPAPIVTEALVLPPEVLRDDESQIINVDSFEEFSLVALCESSEKTSTNSVANRQEEDMITLEPGLAVAGSMMLEINSSESPDQPSPFSVLQPPFEDDQLGSQVELKSNLIDKSPPIESIARTLSWDDSSAEVASPHLLKPLTVPSLDSKIEEKEWLLLVHNLLSAAGLDDQQQYDSFYTRWYSLESPLDPSLRDTLLNEKEPQPMHEGRRRKMRSNHKLVFDYINAALLELVGYGSEKFLKGSGNHCRVLIQESAPESTLLVDHIVAKIKELMASGVRCEWDSNSLVVENVVRKEIVQIGWVDLMKLEIDVLGKEIEGDLIQELVENAVVDFTGRA